MWPLSPNALSVFFLNNSQQHVTIIYPNLHSRFKVESLYMGVSKNRGTPKMDGLYLYNGKPS